MMNPPPGLPVPVSGPDESGSEELGPDVERLSAPFVTPPAVEPSEIAASAACGLLQSDRFFLILLCALIALLTVVHLVRLALPGTPVFEVGRLPASISSLQIDINRATWVEWMQLPEIGETLARQIVVDRETRGPFPSIDSLRRVKGIGPVTMNQIRPHLKPVLLDETSKR